MIGICGAGAIGKLWAYRLGADNCAFISSRRTLEDGHANPLQNISFEALGTHTPSSNPPRLSIPLYNATNLNNVADSIKALLICTKSYDALEAAISLDKALAPSIPLVLFQNGLGSQQRIIAKLTSRPIFAASTTSGANINTKEQLVLAGDGETLIGALNKLAEDMIGQKIIRLLKANPATVHRLNYAADIESILWKKLLINCGINAITALENVPNGKIIETQTFQELWKDLINELTLLAPKANIKPSCPEIEVLILDVAEKTGKNISSMLQDVRAGKQTEVDDINGYASKALGQLNHSAHANEELARRVHALRN